MPEETKFRKIFQDLVVKGKLVKPRGLWVKEIENYSYELKRYWRFPSFQARKLNLDYVKQEFLWYLKGDKYDTSITEHAKMWKDLINEDGSINSNYGFYIFNQGGFDGVVKTLKEDKDSRRAIIMILDSYHLIMKTKDVPCTISIGFRIRNDKLNMTVRMRSQDAVFGMGNDAPAFSFLHEMMLNALREFYPDLKQGSYYHSADSFHVYERHFDMIDQIAVHNDKFIPIEVPRISGPEEVRALRRLHKVEENQLSKLPDQFRFTKWLLTKEKEDVQLPGNQND